MTGEFLNIDGLSIMDDLESRRKAQLIMKLKFDGMGGDCLGTRSKVS